MKQSGYAKRLRQKENAMFNAGKSTREQYAADCFARAMRRHGISKAMIAEIFADALADGEKFSNVFKVTTDKEADVAQEHFDAPLKEIFGERYVSFEQRYEWVKKIIY